YFYTCRGGFTHIRLCRKAMVMGPEQDSRQGLYGQRGGPHGGEVEPPAASNPECLAATCLPRKQRGVRNAADGLPGLKRGNARAAFGSRPSGPHFPLGTFLQFPP